MKLSVSNDSGVTVQTDIENFESIDILGLIGSVFGSDGQMKENPLKDVLQHLTKDNEDSRLKVDTMFDKLDEFQEKSKTFEGRLDCVGQCLGSILDEEHKEDLQSAIDTLKEVDLESFDSFLDNFLNDSKV